MGTLYIQRFVDLETVSDEGYWGEVGNIKGIDESSCSRHIDRRRG